MKRNILLIDDDPIQHELFGCYLHNNQDFRLLNASDMTVAEQIIDTEHVDLIFLDSRMPPYSDYRDTAPKLRDIGYTGEIVVISADVGAPEFQNDQSLGIKSHIDKQSFSLNTFPSLIDDLTRSAEYH